MLPYVSLFGKSVPMYGVMILVGAVVSLLYFWRREKRCDFPEADAELALVYCVIGVIVGAKLLWLATVWSEFVEDLPYLFTMPQDFLKKYLSGGFVFYGGLFGAIFAAWLYCRINQLAFFGLARLMMPLVPLFHGFGRLGCFFMGCCYGCVSKSFGIAFTHSEIAPNGVPLVPVQLIEAVVEFLLFFVLAWLARKKDSGNVLFSTWLLSYGALRFVLEFFRGDDYRGFLGILSVSQALSFAAVILGIVTLIRSRKSSGAVTA